MRLVFTNEPKLEGRVLTYITRPNVYGVYPAAIAARTLDDLYTLAYQFTDEINPEDVKKIQGGYCLEQFLLEPPKTNEECDILATEIEDTEEIVINFPENMPEEDLHNFVELARDQFFYHALMFSANAYLSDCADKKEPHKEPFPNYAQCTPKEFLYLFDDLHEGLVEAQTHDEGMAITLDMMQLCDKSPFARTIVPSMCGIANNGHPRREEILQLYNTLVHCVVDQEFELAAEMREKIRKATRFDYRTGHFRNRPVRNYAFTLPKQIAEDICMNMEAAQILEYNGECVIMRGPRKDEYVPGIDSAFLVQTPPKRTTVEIPEEMAKQAGIEEKVNIFAYKDRIEIYASE